MKKIYSLIVLLTMFFYSTTNAGNQTQKPATKAAKKTLVVFFSRTGENYAVGNIKKGNTHIIAEMIAAQTDATLFEIKPKNAYPAEYHACTEAAKKEKESNARPAITADIAVENYDVIFIGYPNWWGDMPMPVYTFIEKHKWQGKTIIPFCTHEGSGLSNTESNIKKACQGATVLEGLAVKGSVAQNQQASAQKTVLRWINGLGL